MAQSVIINEVTYMNAPEIVSPLVGGGIAHFMDTSDATATAADILSGTTAYSQNTKISGGIPLKQAETITPGTTDQIITSGQYLAGAQTIKGDSNLQPQYIANGVEIFSVTGTLTTPVITQDSSTKVLYIS